MSDSRHNTISEFLRLAASSNPSEQALGRMAQLAGAMSSSGFDWQGLLARARAAGVLPLVCQTLKAHASPLNVPSEVVGATTGLLAQLRLFNQASVGQVERIVQALQAADIQVIAFKGPTLAARLFGNVGLRQFSDLDFLLPDTQREQALGVLETLNYRLEPALDHVSAKQREAIFDYAGQYPMLGDGIPIEPHWAFAPSTLAMDLAYPGVFARSLVQTLPGFSIPIRQLAPADALIAQCVQGAKEQWLGLKWVVDVHESAMRMSEDDWRLFMQLAGQQRLRRACSLPLLLAERLFDWTPPDGLGEWLLRDAGTLEMAAASQAAILGSEARQAPSIYRFSAFQWQLRESWRDRCRYLMRTAFTPRQLHFESLPLPGALHGLYPLYKPVHDYLMLPVWLLAGRVLRRDS